MFKENRDRLMKKFNDRISKLYLLLFYFLNIIYIGIGFFKYEVAVPFNQVTEEVKKDIFYQLYDLSKILLVIEYVIILMNIILLIVANFCDRSQNYKFYSMKKYLITNIFCLGSIPIIAFIVSLISFVPIGNIYQQILIPAEITFIVLFIYLIKMGYHFLMLKIKRNHY